MTLSPPLRRTLAPEQRGSFRVSGEIYVVADTEGAALPEDDERIRLHRLTVAGGACHVGWHLCGAIGASHPRPERAA